MFFGGYTSAFGHLALFKIIASFLGELSVCPLNLCEAGMKGMALHVHLTRELLIPAPPPASLGMEVGNVSSHNGHIAQTCCLGHGRGEGRQEQNRNVLIVSFHHLFTTAVPRSTYCI